MANGNNVIVNVASGLVMEDTGLLASVGDNVIDQGQLNVGPEPAMADRTMQDGFVTIVNASSGLVLDDPTGLD